MKIRLDTSDLSFETLLAIQKDLAKYSHLSAYSKTFDRVQSALVARNFFGGEKGDENT